MLSTIQALSCDEAFLDMTECLHHNPEEVTQRIRSEIFHATKCTASAGIAENMLLARLATRSAKPNGQCYIPSEKVIHMLLLRDMLLTACLYIYTNILTVELVILFQLSY